jgi:hypothetical protein
MKLQPKGSYTEPVLVVQELLRDVTGQKYWEKTSDKTNDSVG